MIIDTHCHIDLYKDPKSILDLCEKHKTIVLSMTNLPSHFEMGLPFFQSMKYVRPCLGMHPLHADLHEKEFSAFERNLSKTSYIGEVGLDFSREGISSKKIQVQSFEKILQLVSGQKKILSIHSRGAEKEVLELLIKNKINTAIFHWYSGGLNLIDEIIRGGFYFSINPSMVKSVSGRKIISKIPKEFVLTETDGPFVSEENNPLNPGEVFSVINYLAKGWGVSSYEVENMIQSNFLRLIGHLK